MQALIFLKMILELLATSLVIDLGQDLNYRHTFLKIFELGCENLMSHLQNQFLSFPEMCYT